MDNQISSATLTTDEVTDKQGEDSDSEWIPSTSLKPLSQKLKVDKPRTKAKKKVSTVMRSVIKPKKLSEMRRKWLQEVYNWTDEQIKSLPCCDRSCFKSLNVAYLRDKMMFYRTACQDTRRQALFQMLCSDNTYAFDGKRICNIFLTTAFRFSTTSMAYIRGPFNDLRDRFSHDILQQVAQSSSHNYVLKDEPNHHSLFLFEDTVVNFLRRLVDETGDFMPDKNEVHLPFYRTKDVYEVFLVDFKSIYPSISISPYSSFMRVWRAKCDNIKVRKCNRFKECTVCVQIRTSLRDCIIRKEPTNILKAQKNHHNQFVRRERLDYTKKKELSILHPHEYLSVTFDGADQKAFCIPHFVSDTKDSRGHGLQVHLIGALQHSTPNKLRLFTMTAEHESGANHIIECCRRFFTELYLLKKLPRKVFIRFDNCVRENKNRFIFSYLEYLVSVGLFDEVEVSFLPVGHTHCDIDQAFSTTAERLRHNDAVTLDDLHDVVRKCYNNYTSVTSMNQLGNWSGLCTKTKCLNEIEGITQFRHFRIISQKSTTNSENNANVKPKVTVRGTIDDEWKPLPTKTKSSDPQFLKFLPDLSLTPPESLVSPPDRSDIILRIQSEESRIVPSKLQSLYQMVNEVYKDRSVKLHWDYENGIETPKLNHSANTFDLDENSEIQTHVPTTLSQIYSYDIHTMIAVKCGESEYQLPFWVGEIIDAESTANGITREITVHWYEFYNNDDVFCAKYRRAYGNDKKPWTDKIGMDSVFNNFPRLTMEKRLPVAVINHLRTVTAS